MIFSQPPTTAPPTAPPLPALPAGSPWWAFLLLGLAPLLVTALVQVLLHRRKTAGLTRLQKDVAVHGSTLTEHGAAIGALKQHATEPAEKTDPAIVQARESQRQGLEQRVQRLEQRADATDGEIRDIKRRSDEDRRADGELKQQIGRIEGILEVKNGNGARSRR